VTSGCTVTRNAEELTAGTWPNDGGALVDFTMPDILDSQEHVILGGLTSTRRWSINIANTLRLNVGVNSVFVSGLDEGERHKVAMNYSNTDSSVYHTDDENNSASGSGTISIVGDTFRIGFAGTGTRLRGRMHKVQRYDVQLTNTQTDQLVA